MSVCLLFLAWNLPLCPDVNGKCFAILTSFSKIWECSCVHTELKLTSFHAFCTKLEEGTHASTSSSLVILAAIEDKEVLGVTLPLAGVWLLECWLLRGCSSNPAGIWKAFLNKHFTKKYVQKRSLIEISFFCSKIIFHWKFQSSCRWQSCR